MTWNEEICNILLKKPFTLLSCVISFHRCYFLCVWTLSFSNSWDRCKGCWELSHQCDKPFSPPDRRLPVPLVLPAALYVRPGTSGDTSQTRTSWGSGQAGLLQRFPSTQSEDFSLQTTAVTAHERVALHHAAQVWLPHEEYRWVQDPDQLSVSFCFSTQLT